MRFSPTALQLWDPKGGIVALDGLRGIAIFLVLLRHATYPVVAASEPGGALNNPIINLMVNGWMGVDLFFVLSGFLIGSHVMRMRESAVDGKFAWGRYMQNRFLRIVPTYAFVVAIVVAGLIPLYNVGTHDLAFRIFYHALFLQDYLPSNFIVAFWSLGVEEKFYLLAPFVIGLGFMWQARWRHGMLMAFSLMILLSVLSRTVGAMVLENVPYQTFFEVFRSPFHHCLDALGLGMVAALLHKNGVAKTYGHHMVWLGAGGVLLLLTTSQLLAEISVWDMVLQPTLIASCFALMVLGAAYGGGPKRVLESRTLIVHARLSYPLYLIHMAVIPLAWALSGAQTSDGLVGLLRFLPFYAALAYGAAYGIHVLVEKPFLEIKERMSEAAKLKKDQLGPGHGLPSKSISPPATQD